MLEIVYHQLTESVNHATTQYADKHISKLPRIRYYKEDRSANRKKEPDNKKQSENIERIAKRASG